MNRACLVLGFITVAVLSASPACTTCNGGGPPARAPSLKAGDHRRSLTHDGRKRSYILHVPPQYNGATALPLVFMLHGGTGTARQAARAYGWSEKADVNGFFVVYPDGVGNLQTWNAGHCCGAALRDDVDDIGFIAAIVNELSDVVEIDTHRIYATGMSNGGMFSHRLGAERPDLFAAIGPVAGTIGGQPTPNSPQYRPAAPGQHVPVIMFHGQQDHNVQYSGGPTESQIGGTRVDLSQAETVAFWVATNGCDPTPTTTVLADGDVIREAYANSSDGTEVILNTIVDGGHSWPGAKGGRTPATQDISATDEIWAFFVAHPKP